MLYTLVVNKLFNAMLNHFLCCRDLIRPYLKTLNDYETQKFECSTSDDIPRDFKCFNNDKLLKLSKHNINALRSIYIYFTFV